MTKMKIRAFSIPYCVKEKDRQALKKSLERDLESLQETPDSKPISSEPDVI